MPGRAGRLWLAGGALTAAVATGAFVLLTGDEPPVVTATLRVLAIPVEVVDAAGESAAAVDAQLLEQGGTVRTGPGGRAAIEYSDGSVTRLDHATTLTLTTLDVTESGSSIVQATQDAGNTYHRVVGLSAAGNRFAVVTPTATVSVQGTVYAVLVGADGATTVAVFDGTVLVETAAGPVAVGPGFMVTVRADGSVLGPVPIPADLAGREWIWFNQCELDGDEDCPGVWPPTPGFDHLEIAPLSSEIVAGATVTYSVTAVGADGMPLGDVTAGAIITGPGCSGAICTPNVAGSHVVTAGYAGATVTAALTVTPGPLAAIGVTPGVAAVAAGTAHTFGAAGYDAFANPLGSVDAAFVMADGSCDGSSCSSTVVGDHIITAAFEEFSATAMLTVVPGPLARIAVSPESATVTAGSSQPYSATGFDTFDNPRGEVAAVFTIDGDPCQDGVCVSTVAGDHEVIAAAGTVSESAVLTVVPGPLYGIVIYPRATTVGYGQPVEYTAIGYDAHGNSRGAVAATYGITPGGTCQASWCLAYGPGTYVVTGYFHQLTSSATLTAN